MRTLLNSSVTLLLGKHLYLQTFPSENPRRKYLGPVFCHIEINVPFLG